MNTDEHPITFDELVDLIPRVPAAAELVERHGKPAIIRHMVRNGHLPSHDDGTVFYRSEIEDHLAEQERWRHTVKQAVATSTARRRRQIIEELDMTEEQAERLGFNTPVDD